MQFISLKNLKTFWDNLRPKVLTRADLVEYATADSQKKIESLIPEQANTSNQLADKDFVNSSISTNTAYFKGTFNSLEELQQVENPSINDYGFVIKQDEHSNTVYDRYKWNGSNWVFEFSLNNSSFTSDQWKAVNSNITEELVQKLINLPNVEGPMSIDEYKASAKDSKTLYVVV